ncbi:MAG: bL28 family ribosomal protein [Deinococcales bacterium]
MPKVCAITGRKTRSIKTVTRSGSAKKKGGVGLKRTGVHNRTQKANLQKKTIWLDGKPQKVWLSTKALREMDPSLLSNPNKR